jgi:hypothetical protein
VEESFVWMTTRRVRPGTLAGFKRTWRPERRPDGMLHAYAYWSDDEREIIAVRVGVGIERLVGHDGSREMRYHADGWPGP